MKVNLSREELSSQDLIRKYIIRLAYSFSILLLLAILLSYSLNTLAAVQLVGGLTHRYTVVPGEEYQGSLKLLNSGEELAAVKVYQRDYSFQANGRTFYLKPRTLPRSNTGWLSLTTGTIEIPPGKEQSLPYLIRVPDEEGLKGTYWSIIMVEPVLERAGQTEEGRAPGGQVGIRQGYSYGVQIVTDLHNSGEKELIFKRPKLSFDEFGKAYQFRLELENIGAFWLIPEVWLELYNQAGEKVGRFSGQKFRLFPGTSVAQEFDLGLLEAGTYQALIIADNRDEAIFAIKYNLQVQK